MMRAGESAKSLWWLIHKDLTRELRAQSVLPVMLLMGLLLVFLLALQLELPWEQKTHAVGGLMWLAIFFAGTLAFDRSFASERDNGAWRTLTLYPVDPATVFLAKLAVNFVSLVVLELALIPAFIVLSDVPLLGQPARILSIAALGSIGFAAVGTLVSALTAGLQHRGGLVALLVLPLATPVLLASAEATRIVLIGDVDSRWWQWLQLLAVFAVVFTVVGALVFESVMEE
jgi:heme exporter protein B